MGICVRLYAEGRRRHRRSAVRASPGFTPEALDLIKKASAFLVEMKDASV